MSRRDFFFYSLLIFLLILIAQLPIILRIFHTPQGYYYPYLDKVSFSDFYYLGLIRYGMGESWMLKIPYVTLPHDSSLIQVFFVWLGKLANVVRTGPAEIFAVFRVIGGIVFLTSSLFFFKTILSRDKAKWVFVFFLLAQPLVDDFGAWIWHFGEAARRVSAMPPHYTLGKGLSILSLAFFILYLKRSKVKFLYLASLIIFLAGLIYPPPVFILVISLILTAIVTLLTNYCSRVNLSMNYRRYVLAVTFYLISAVLPLLILKLELNRGYPWGMWNTVELGWNVASQRFEIGYLKMTGVLLFLGILGAITRLKNNNFWDFFMSIWAFSAFLLFPFADVLRLGKFRFIEGAQIVPLAVLAFEGFEILVKKFGIYFRNTFLIVFIGYFLATTNITAYLSTVSLWPYYKNVYFEPEEISTLHFMENNIQKDSIVLADVYPSNYLPAFAQVRTIIGFSDAYLKFSDFEKERDTIEEILRGNLQEKEVLDYLVSRKVSYVYRKKYIFGDKILYPRLMRSIYQSPNYEIYKVEK